jgi:hypothetical protein
MNKHDPFDPANLRIDPTDPAFAAKPDTPNPKRKTSKWKRQFTLFPYTWQERLQGCKAGSTYRLALYLLYEHWRNRGRRIRLSNGVLAAEGVRRTVKLDGLRELERAGLVQVQWRLHKAPLVTCLLVGDLPENR